MHRLIDLILKSDGDRIAVTKLLQGICDILKADGCILWRATSESTKESGKYTMLASWFDGIDDSYPSIRSLPYANKNKPAHASAKAGSAWLNNHFLNDPNNYAQDRFFHVHDIRHAMVMRFDYVRSSVFGVVTVYRKDNPFLESELERLAELTSLLPNLYRTARDRTGYKLISHVAEILRRQTQKYDAVRRGKDLKGKRAKTALAEEFQIQQETIAFVGGAVRDSFCGLDTSIFLDSEAAPGAYTCFWTDERVREVVDVSQHIYKASLKRPNGFGGLVLKTGESVHIYDTQDVKRDEEDCRKREPEFEGHSGHAANAAERANRFLGVDLKKKLPPPHSLVIAPILANGRVLGFMRCWIALTNPQFYSQDDEDLLRLVALDLGRVLGDWREKRLRRARKEKVEKFTDEAWKDSGYTFNLSHSSHGTDSLTKDVLKAILELVDALVPGSDINSVRLLDKETQEFYFYLFPSRGTLVAGENLQRLHKKRHPLAEKNLAAKVCKRPPFEPMLFRDLDENPMPGYTALYEGVRNMIIAPIVVNGEVEGVLDIRSKSDELLEPEALEWTKIIVFMMSLLIASQRHQAEKRDAERAATLQAAQNDRNLRDAFEDLAHQMKSPLIEAQNRVSQWSQRNPLQVSRSDVQVMQSLIDRAQHTTNLINLFSAFSSGKMPAVSRAMISPGTVAQIIDEVCANALPRIHPHRNIRIAYDTNQALRHAPGELRMERRLLAESLNNLVDNAIKYSFSNTIIEVAAGRTGKGRFYISVRNRGIRVRPQDMRHMTERSWRGAEAQLAVGEGSGLGLYIVNLIMKLHGCWLDIIPTNDTSGVTDVRLIFPSETES